MTRFARTVQLAFVVQLGVLATPAVAQEAAAMSQNPAIQPMAPAATVPVPSPAVTVPSAGPTAEATRAGIAPYVSAERTLSATTPPDKHLGAGQNVALMIVGGAALLAGLIIGGNGGGAVAIGGAVVGLYGLYNFLQ